MNINGTILFTALTLFLAAVSCGKEQPGGGEPEVAGVTVNFAPDRNTVFPNPLCGWVLYAGLGNDLSDFWERYDNMPSSIGTVRATDYAKTLLVRTTWGQLNPEDGVYIWQDGCNTVYAQRYRKLVAEAHRRNMRIGYGFAIDSRDKHEFCTPLYVRDKYGAKGYATMTGSMEVWSPYPDDPAFQKC